jgi:hypothetical protein
VIARTPDTPHIYYYRRRVDASYWTPWEKVDVDVQGDIVAPVVWHHRLSLFWLEPRQEPKKQPLTLRQDSALSDPPNVWTAYLAWSVYSETGWSPKNLAKQPVQYEGSEDLQKHHIDVRGWTDLSAAHAQGNDLLFWIVLWAGDPTDENGAPLSAGSVPVVREASDQRPVKSEAVALLEAAAYAMPVLYAWPDWYTESTGFLMHVPGGLYKRYDKVLDTYLPDLETSTSDFWCTSPILFLADDRRTFFVTSTGEDDREIDPSHLVAPVRFQFHRFYDPFVRAVIRQLNVNGVEGALQRATTAWGEAEAGAEGAGIRGGAGLHEAAKGRHRWSMQMLADRLIELAMVPDITDEAIRLLLKRTSSSRGSRSSG